MDYESAAVINDVHIPFQDNRAVSLFLKVVADQKPDKVFLNGDICDCFEVSRFTKHPKHSIGLAKEFKLTRDFLSDLRKAAPRAHIIYIMGNHEYRLEKFILDHARELHGLEGISFEEQIHAKKYDVEIVNHNHKEQHYRWGKLLIGHFDKVNKHAGYTAKNLLEDKGMSVIQGHTHRMGMSSKRLFDKHIVAYENGCLCDINPGYTAIPNWCQGMSVVHKSKTSDHFQVQQLFFISHGKTVRTFYGGKLYEA